MRVAIYNDEIEGLNFYPAPLDEPQSYRIVYVDVPEYTWNIWVNARNDWSNVEEELDFLWNRG